MITRYAIFEGTIKAGQDQAFHDFVDTRMVPIWTRFPGAVDIRIFRERERDEGAPGQPLILAISYLDEAAMERALASDVRAQSRAATEDLMKLLDGRIRHYVTDTTILTPRS